MLVKSAIALVLLASLTGCGKVYSKTLNVEKRNIDGTECVVASSQAGTVSIDCDFGQR